MCIFSGPVKSVSNTRIFARQIPPTSGMAAMQSLVYKMRFDADSPVAMILPLPVDTNYGQNALTFVDLSRYPNFFDLLDEKFPKPNPKMGLERRLGRSIGSDTLPVHQVGRYEASFVPNQRDFERLDSRFVLPKRAWDQLPQYADYGFAVFKLNDSKPAPPPSSSQWPTRRHSQSRPDWTPAALSGPQDVHPMAFLFIPRFPNSIFFPTIHIHDGDVHQFGDFDHELYVQSEELGADLVNGAVTGEPWLMSSSPLSGVGPGNVIDPDRRGYKATLKGELSNVDVILRRGRA
jgi:hypothetical protein